MKAVIMAGGKGTRLYPLTAHLPKPLLPLNNIPCITHILRLLHTHGITEAAVTTGYLADKLEKALGRETEGVSLTYFREDTPLGTAGGVAQTRDFIGNEDFVVISGDALCEIDLSAAFAARKNHDALALLVLTRVSDPGEFGVVLLDREGAITGFSEKPSLSGTFSDTVNTGIYVFSPAIFSHIPEGVCDFGRDLFPSLLRQGKRLFGHVDTRYWCDIGNHTSYRLANLRLSDGENVVGPHSIVPRQGIVSSVIGRHCQIAEGVRIEDAILCDHVTVASEACIGGGSVIGRGCRIGEGAVLSDGTVLPPDTVVPDGAWLRAGGSGNLKTIVEPFLSENGLLCPLSEMTAPLAVRLGAALAEACERGKIGLMSDGTSEGGRITAALLRGIRANGSETILLGQGFEAMASYAAPSLGLSLSLFVRVENHKLAIAFFDRYGLYPAREIERRFLAALSRDGEPYDQPPKAIVEMEAEKGLYWPMLLTKRCALEGFPIAVVRDNPASLLLTRALLAMGGKVGNGGLRLSLSDDGFLLSAEQDGFAVDDWHVKALLLRYLIRDRIALPVTTPETVLDLCRGRCQLYTHCPTEDETSARLLATLRPELIHGAAAAMELVGLLAVSGRNLKELCRPLPSFACRSADLLDTSEGRLGILPNLGSPAGDGVVTTYAHGSVRVIPSRRGFRLMSEAASGEFAEEILTLSEKEIKRLLEGER